jgi:hypothetical protein
MANTVPAVIPCVTPPEPVEEQLVTLEEAQGAVEILSRAKASSVFFASSASRSIKRSTPPQPVSAAEADAGWRQRRPLAGGEPLRGHAGGVDESFFRGGSTGKRTW